MRRILQRGRNYWRIAPVRSAGLLVDGRNYYAAFAAAARQARRYILLAGWQFDSSVPLERDTTVTPGLLAFLNELCTRNPKLRVYILAWDFNVFYTLKREFLQALTFEWNAHPRVQFRFDNTAPLGASHHQKFVVVDGMVAFAGGMDLCAGTWDERDHRADNPRRVRSDGEPYHPRHDVQAYLTGGAARRLARLFADRWRRAGGNRLRFRPVLRWPPRVAGDLPLAARFVVLSRTFGETAVPRQMPVREVRQLFVDAIQAAESLIYIENQYFASAAVYEALVARMRAANRLKLQIVVLLPRQPEDFIEEIGLGTTQARYLRALATTAQQTGHALGIYNTRASGDNPTGKLTFIHAKLLIVDDRFLTVGSANFSNRSMGFDSELNLAWESRSRRRRHLAASIQAARVDLLAEHAGITDRQRLSDHTGLVTYLDSIADQPSSRLCRHQSNSSLLSEIVTDFTPHDLIIDPEHSLLPVDENGLFAKGITALSRRLFGQEPGLSNSLPTVLCTSMNPWQDSLVELIRRTSAEIPDDVYRSIVAALEREKKGTIAASAMQIIDQNIALAKRKSQPICQDTGSVLFYVDCPAGFDQITFTEAARAAVKVATQKGYLRQNSVDSLTGKNDGTNLGPGAPTLHFHQHQDAGVQVRLMLKGGGCENVGAQYSLPDESIQADRDLAGCRKAILDAVLQAQGKGCGPGVLGVCIGGDRATGYEFSKTQLLRKLDDRNPNADLDKLEQDILATANELGIGPMGFGGKTTLLGVKITAVNRVPASYFVSISYMCWAYRRQGARCDAAGNILDWLY